MSDSKNKDIEPYRTNSSFLEHTLKERGIELDEGQKQALSKYGGSMIASSVLSMVQKCKGTDCPIINVCQLHSSGVPLPVGDHCPIEESLIKEVLSDYCAGLDIEVDKPMGRLELMQVLEIVRHEVIQFRAHASLSNRPEVVRKTLVKVELTKDKIYEDRIAPEIDIIDKLDRLKSKIRSELLATRRSQLLREDSTDDVSAAAIKLIKDANMRKMLKMREKDQRIGKEDIEVIDD